MSNNIRINWCGGNKYIFMEITLNKTRADVQEVEEEEGNRLKNIVYPCGSKIYNFFPTPSTHKGISSVRTN